MLFGLHKADQWNQAILDTTKNFLTDLLADVPLQSNHINLGMFIHQDIERGSYDMVFALNNNMNPGQIVTVIKDLYFSGGVSQSTGLPIGRTSLKYRTGDTLFSNLYIIVTLGHFPERVKIRNKRTDQFKTKGPVYVVCIGNGPDMVRVNDISSDPDSQYSLCKNNIALPGYIQILKKECKFLKFLSVFIHWLERIVIHRSI